MRREAINIAVGTFEGRPGISVIYEDEPSYHLFFGLDQAYTIGQELMRLAQELQYVKTQVNGGPGDGIQIADFPFIKLQGGENENV